MTLHNFKLSRPAAPSVARTRDRSHHSANPDAVPVREMAVPALPPISRDDVAEAEEIARLLELPFPVFAQTVARLLETLGYANVQTMKAMHGQGKGRNAHGGYDLRMYLPTRLTRGLVIAQVKQYRETVPRSFVDELRGAMLRLGASQGLLVTTGAFSASAIEAAQSAQHAAPVRLMDGSELARLLRADPKTLERVPSPALNRLPPASALRPFRQEESGGREAAFVNGMGLPPDEKARSSSPAAPQQENRMLILRVTVSLSPAVPGERSTGGHSDAAQEERRRG